LVTGSDGFIGSHLVEMLVAKGCRVKSFVYYNSFNSWGWLDTIPEDKLSEVEIFTGDIRDPNSVKTAVNGVDIVFHLAALTGIPFSYYSPDSYVDTNIKGTLNILQACRDCKIERVIHTSTSEVYGTAQYVPINEKHPLQAQSPYSASKIGADAIAMSFHKSFNLSLTIARPFNTYGPRQSARAIIPTIITRIASGNNEIPLGALEPTRDFSYVKDIVRAFIAILESEKSIGEVINVGSNFEISIGDTVQLIAEAMNAEISVQRDERRIRPDKSEVRRLCADNSKAKKLLGWEPEYGGREGMKRALLETIDWFKKPDNLINYKAGIYNV
jgi:dTDP-glucose 4,6-dehydratase